MTTSKKYSQEVRERSVSLVLANERAHESLWAAIKSVAENVDCTAETLGKWVYPAERDHGRQALLTTDEREPMKELEREVRELRRANEILRRASAYFAQAELDRRRK